MTQVLNHTLLEGETPTGGDLFQDFVTFHQGVKPGERVRLVRDEIKARGWTSEVNGRCATDCGFWPRKLEKDAQIDKALCTKAVGQDYVFCVKKLRDTWRGNLLPLGQNREAEQMPVDIMDEVLYATIKNNLILIDTHAWGGDYGSADEDRMHVDGFIKIAVKALEEEKPFIVQYILSDIALAETVWFRVGAQYVSVPANVDAATTIADVVTALSNTSYVDEDGKPLFASVVADGPDTVAGGAAADGEAFTITYPVGEFVTDPLQITIADAQGVELCYTEANGVLTPSNSAFSTTNMITACVLQMAAGSSTKPIGIKKVKINKSNVIQQLIRLYEAIQEEKEEILNDEFGGILFVAPNIFNALKLAIKGENTQFVTSCGAVQVCSSVYFERIVKMNYLPANEMFYARREDLHMATDLLSDVNEISNTYDPVEDCIKTKNRFALGFQISDTGQIAGTFCNREMEFGNLMPCENQNC